MELSVAKKDLLRLLSRLQGVADRKNPQPVLSNVLFSPDGANGLRISATDLYLSMSGRIPAEVTRNGNVAIPAKEIFERVKLMPDGPVLISSNESASTTVKASGSARRFTLRSLPGTDFPPLPTPAEGAPTLALDVAVLRELIEKTHFSISTDETRAHLNSALFEWDGDIVRMVSTDGHRLSKVELKVTGRQASATMLIPLKAISELRRLCDDAGGESAKDGEKPQLQITQSGSSAFFSAPNMVFSVKLVEAQFPPYAQVIPKTNDKTIRVPRAAFADALKAVSIASSERTGGVRLEIDSGVMRITSESAETGNAFDEIPVEYTGSMVRIGVNSKYFLDILSALDEEEVLLLLSGELDPCVLRPVGPREFLAVVMPMRI